MKLREKDPRKRKPPTKRRPSPEEPHRPQSETLVPTNPGSIRSRASLWVDHRVPETDMQALMEEEPHGIERRSREAMEAEFQLVEDAYSFLGAEDAEVVRLLVFERLSLQQVADMFPERFPYKVAVMRHRDKIFERLAEWLTEGEEE